jgi:hypothetical protein
MSHHHGQSCSCCAQNHCCSSHGAGGCCCSCHHHSCGCSCHQHQGCHSHQGYCEHAHKLLEIADMAWMEVLKEEIKKNIQANDHKIKEIAQIVSEANRERWKNKMTKEKCCAGYEDKLKQLFHPSCCQQ